MTLNVVDGRGYPIHPDELAQHPNHALLDQLDATASMQAAASYPKPVIIGIKRELALDPFTSVYHMAMRFYEDDVWRYFRDIAKLASMMAMNHEHADMATINRSGQAVNNFLGFIAFDAGRRTMELMDEGLMHAVNQHVTQAAQQVRQAVPGGIWRSIVPVDINQQMVHFRGEWYGSHYR